MVKNNLYQMYKSDFYINRFILFFIHNLRLVVFVTYSSTVHKVTQVPTFTY